MKDCELCRHFVLYVTSRFVTALLLSDIIKMYTEKTNSFRCDICEKVLNRKDNYDRHVRVCKAEFKCFYCDYTFKFSSHRALHVHREHKDKLFKCDNCCAEFSDERKYQRHQQTCKV